MPEETKNGSAAPDVTPTLPTKPTEEFLDQAKLELSLRLQLRQEYEKILEIWKNDELGKLAKQNEETIGKGLEELAKKIRDEIKPPEPQEIQKLLDQEYETFTLKVDYIDEDESEQSQTFTIRELPQSVEKKFYRQFKEKLLTKLQLLEAFTQTGIDKPFEEKAQSFLSLFDESFDLLADAVVLCLNPFGRKKEINKEWVQNNISSDRQWSIIEAQMKVNRLRDFFSRVSTSGRDTMMTMRRPSFQQLQQLVH